MAKSKANSKTRKSVSKRIRATRNGKLVRRPMGVDHFRTRQTKKSRRQSRNTRTLAHPKKSIIS